VSETEERTPRTPAGRLAAKLQALYDTLPEDEKQILARLVRLAVEHADVEGYAAGSPARDADSSASDVTSPLPSNPIDDFRVNLGLYLSQDA
jgi:hypothetical protein